MTMIHQKRSHKSYLKTARNARTKGSTPGNQHFLLKLETFKIFRLAQLGSWEKRVNKHGTSWAFKKVI